MKYTIEQFRGIARETIDNPRVPFHRCYRPLVKRVNSGSSEYRYLQDDDYAQNLRILVSRRNRRNSGNRQRVDA